MFPTDFIMYSYFCVDSCDVGADKGIRELPANVKNSICSFCFYWDECRRAGARGPRSRPGTDLRPGTSAASSAPFLHPDVSSSGAAPLRSLPAPPTLSWAEEQTAASPPAATVSSPAAAAAAKPQIVTGRSRHVHADALASTCTPTSGLQHSPHSFFFYRKPDPPWTL